jgi:hypothetical protein
MDIAAVVAAVISIFRVVEFGWGCEEMEFVPAGAGDGGGKVGFRINECGHGVSPYGVGLVNVKTA